MVYGFDADSLPGLPDRVCNVPDSERYPLRLVTSFDVYPEFKGQLSPTEPVDLGSRHIYRDLSSPDVHLPESKCLCLLYTLPVDSRTSGQLLIFKSILAPVYLLYVAADVVDAFISVFYGLQKGL